MKTTTLILILFLTAAGLQAQTPPPTRTLPARTGATNVPSGARPSFPSLPSFPAPPSAARPPGMPSQAAPSGPAQQGNAPAIAPKKAANGGSAAQEEVPGYTFDFPGVDVNQVLDVYANLVGRTLLRAGLPSATITLKTQTKLTKSEAIQALQAVLGMNGISIINIGDKFAKVVPSTDAAGAGGPLDTTPASKLPQLGSYVTHIVQLNYVKPSDMAKIIQPLAKLNSIIPLDSNGILIIRDYAENVKRMLEMIKKVDVNVPQEYISEVIPIKYAQADDIANALNSLGGSGSATVAIGSSGSSPTISGFANRNSINGPESSGLGSSSSYGNNNRRFGNEATSTPSTPNGTPARGGTFQQRLLSIVNRASSPNGEQEQIQVFGQAKIIADERSNSLLVFATRGDMERIKAVIDKLDVLLAQVLIESAVMDVTLNNGWNFGVSAAQNPKTFNPHGSPPVAGGGGVNNGQTFLEFLNGLNGITNAANVFGNNLPSGLSYFGNIGPSWDVAIQAAANNSDVTVIQRPRIQTSQAKPAQFFVGSTVPYITGTSYGTGYSGANSSTYSQLSVGVELDVTPFINPEGLVVMDINQEIDDISGSTRIDGNDVPTTDRRTLSSEIAVNDRDTVMLGGFIRSGKTRSKSGIPILMDIPILGNLFSSRSDSKGRQELIVLIRPTVLQTPEIAAKNTVKEEERLPGITAAAADEEEYETKRIKAEQRVQQRHDRTRNMDNDFFTPVPSQTPGQAPDAGTNGQPNADFLPTTP